MMLPLLITLTQAALHVQPPNPNNLKTVVLIGATGAGKSLFGNMLSDCVGSKSTEVFGQHGDLDPATQQCSEHQIRLMKLPRELRATIGKHNTRFDDVGSFKLDMIQEFLGNDPDEVLVVDTPGLGDNKDNIRMIADKIQDLDTRYGGVDRFIIVVNGEEPRFNEALAKTLREFQEGFTGEDHTTEEWLKHVTFVFTRWSYDQRDVIKRSRQNKPTEDQLRARFNTKVAETIGLSEEYIQQNPVPCIFIDTFSAAECLPNSRRIMLANGGIEDFMVTLPSVRGPSDEYMKYVEQLGELKSQITTVERFPCSHISAAEVVRKRLDAGNYDGVQCIRCTCNEFTGIDMHYYNDDPLGDIRGPGYRCRYCTTYGKRYATDLATGTREGMRGGAMIGYGGGAIVGVGLTGSVIYSLGFVGTVGAFVMSGPLIPVVIVGGCAGVGALAGGAVGAAGGGVGAIPVGAIHAAAYNQRQLTDAPERVTLMDGSVLEIRGRQNRAPFQRPTTNAGLAGEIEMRALS